MTIDLQGIFPPVPTPFEHGRPALDRLAANIDRWLAAGVHGIVILGSNGEYPLLTEAEKRAVVRAAVEAVAGRCPVIAGSGCESTDASIRLSQDCAAMGAAAALVVTPHYYGGKMSAAALAGHFRAIADQSPIPVLLYNVPKFTHINLAPALVAELSRHPNIAGIKDSGGNVSQLGEYLNQVDTGFQVMVGTAGALFGALTLGCVGGILALANVAPEACVQIFNDVAAGRLDDARRLHLRMLPVNTAMTATYGVGGLKAALDMLGYFGGEPRLPLCPPTDAETDQIRQILQKADLLKA